jgi:hypothetical protein
MDLTFFVSTIVAILVPVTAGLFYINTYASKLARLRYLYERLCISNLGDQFVSRDDDRVKKYNGYFSKDAVYVTSIEFIEDPITDKRLMEQLERLSTSIFPSSFLWVWIPGAIVALLITPGLLFALGLFPQVVQLFNGSVSSALAAGGVAGVLTCLLTPIIYSGIKFERHVSEAKVAMERLTIWEVGRERRPANRAIILAKDDPTYVSLTQ